MSGSIETSRRARRSMFYPKADLEISDERLQALRRPDEPDVTAAYREGLQVAVEKCFGGSRRAARVVDIVPLEEQGTFHRIFRVRLEDERRIIARISLQNPTLRDSPATCLAADADHSLIIDAWAHDRLRRSGLAGLEIFTVDVSRRIVPFAYELLAEAPGRSLRDFDHDDARMQPLLTDLGRRLAQMHALRGIGAGLMSVANAGAPAGPTVRGAHDAWPDYVVTRLEAHLATCRDLGAVDAAEARRIEALFAATKSLTSDVPLVLLHGDLGNHNIFTDGERITQLIDWEDCLYGDPVFDLAFWATFHPERRHEWLLSGYREFVPLDEADQRRFYLYFLRIALAKTVLRNRLGIVDMPGRAPAAQRIQNALKALAHSHSTGAHAA
jgi:Ser/Thr protein kinase RdoA (MazF antagonist)